MKFIYDLVHRAVLTCTQATVQDFILPNGQVVPLRDWNPNRKQGELEVDETPVFSNGLCYATVKDTIKGFNIPHFLCNCKQSQISREEMMNIMKDKERHRFGVCRHLMKLEERWSNMPLAEGSYLLKTDTYPTGDGPILDSAEQDSQGIAMTSVLFCKQGGIIYPINSGQEWIKEVINVKKEILALLEESKDLKKDDRIEKVNEYMIKMKEENPDYVEFLEIMHGNESQGTGGYGAVSGTHLGRYQLGDDALERIDFKKNGMWTDIAESLGVITKEEFLENETAQEVAVLFYFRWIYQDIVSNKDYIYIGTTIEQQIGDRNYKVDVTLSGLIAAGHLIG